MLNVRLALRALAAISVLLLAPQGWAAGCRDDAVLLKGDWGQARFSVEVANTEAARAQGLMHRDSMPRSAGMLFIYERPQMVAFWMKNTLISLDMIFADATGVVRRVHHGAVPGDLTPIPGGRGILAVLEINGGLARAMGIKPGTVLRHPAFEQDTAAWPCDN
ncbi:DUF192 domain-containing protein [Thalassovita taeanensis]|uniref:DUF192 domain-containing protein n=1 Tax=Thalassovita taeanensis TaxID=657014 RepID=A0A1H8YYN7_9RHOB|nr:DUF192 domain-containing protein [Thalassovita taeanensis]SEP56488.1 hypothetical protein SAMN04488092_101170 [Thalassovita taeanensis]